MKGSAVVAMSALSMVLVYVFTVTLLGAGASTEPAFLFGDSMTTKDPLAIHRYLGFAAIAIAMAHILWVTLRTLRVRRERKSGRRRWDQREGRDAPRASNHPALSGSLQTAAKARKVIKGQTRQLPPGLDLLEQNQEIDLFGDEGFEGQCQRGVLVHQDAGHLVVRVINDTNYEPWRPGDTIYGYFFMPGDSGYVFEAEVIENRQIGANYVVMSLPRRVDQKQRRVYVRAPYRERVRFLHVPIGKATQWIGGASDEKSSCIFEGMTEDISAGGFRMVTNAPLNPGDYISIDNFPPAEGELLVRVSAQLDSDEGGEFQRYGVQYVGIDSTTRDHITREVFRLHREMLATRAQSGERPG